MDKNNLANAVKNYETFWKSDTEESEYNDLKEGKYILTFSIDPESGLLTYEAVSKDSDFKGRRYLKASLTPDGTFIDPSQGNSSLMRFLIDEERDMTPSQFEQRYKAVYAIAKTFIGLTKEQVDQRKNARKAFLDLFGTTEEKKQTIRKPTLLPTQMETPRIKLSIKNIPSQVSGYYYSYKDQYTYAFALRSFYKNYASNIPLDGFIRAYMYHLEFQIATSFKRTVTPGLFSEKENALIQHVAWYMSLTSNLNNGFFGLGTDAILTLADIAKGDSILYEGNTYALSVASPQAEVKITSEDKITLFPVITKNNSFIQGKDKLLVFDNLRRTATLYTFPNETISKLYGYFLLYGTNNYDLVEDLLSKNVIPVVGTSLIQREVDSETGELEPLPFSILTMVDLSLEQELVFKTQYIVNNQELSPEEAGRNPFYNALMEDYKRKLAEVGGVENGVGDASLFFNTDLSELKKVSTVYLSDKIKRLRILNTPPIQFNVSHGIDWLSVSVKSDELTDEEMEKVFKAYKAKRKYTILNDRMILLDEEKLAKIKALMDSLKMKNDELLEQRVPFFDLIKLNQSKDLVDVQLDDYLQNTLVEISHFKETPLELASNFTAVLRDYQEDAVKWLYVLNKNHMCGILADDMGLGKTLEMIAFLSTVKTEKPILVVCPKSLVYNWAKEFQKWDEKVPVITLDGTKEERKTMILGIENTKKIIYVTSYDSLRNDLDIYKKKDFSNIVLDEAQYIKNQSTQKSKAVKLLQADSRFALTGTPIENSLGDLWSIFDFLMPGYLDSYDNFKEDYESKIDGKMASEEKENLTKKVLPFILRRTKEDVLKSLPPKTVEMIYVNMTDKQKDLYQAFLQKARDSYKLGNKGKLQFLAALMRLRQICVDPSSFLANYHELSAKLSLASKQIENSISSGHKVLVFSSFTSVLEHLRELLRRDDLDPYYINGQTSAKERVRMAEEFNSPSGNKIMLVSLKAGGTGLNLIGADTVIHLDPWWNFAAEEQATDRAHRIGQTRPVNVYKLICHDTVEERVIDLQNAKKDLYDAIIQSGDQGLTKLSAEDIKFILG